MRIIASLPAQRFGTRSLGTRSLGAKSLRSRLIVSMTVLLCGGLAVISALHALAEDGSRFGRLIGRALLGDELPEPWQDLSVLVPFGLVMLSLIGVVTGWSLRPLLRASQEAAAVGPQNPQARIDTANLPSELSPMVDAINRALDRLTAAFENERRFTADAAHELRTPLATLSLRLQRARRDGVPIEWPGVEADLAAMRRLIEALLDLARKEATRTSRQTLNLSRIAREAAADIEPLIDEAGRTFLVDLPAHLAVTGDPDDLRDMVRNLVRNALSHGEGQITLALRADAARAILEVGDEGAGVPAAERDRVFERFHKGSAASTGSGLGLAIVRAVASSHGGDAGFVEAPGCLVRVTLPRQT